MIRPTLKVVRAARRIVPHLLHIDLSDAAMEARIEQYTNKYKWYIRKENRFAATLVDGFMDFGMADAFDEGVTDYAEYIRTKSFVQRDREIGVAASHWRARMRSLKTATSVRASRIRVKADRKIPRRYKKISHV